MFVRFRQTSRRLQLSLAETHRTDGKVRHEHIAGLGAISRDPTVSEKAEFWKRLFERLERLANRLDDETRNTILEAVLVPRANADRTGKTRAFRTACKDLGSA